MRVELRVQSESEFRYDSRSESESQSGSGSDSGFESGSDPDPDSDLGAWRFLRNSRASCSRRARPTNNNAVRDSFTLRRNL